MAEAQDPLWLLDNARRDSARRSAMCRFEDMSCRCPISGCWIWVGPIATRGYGCFKVDGKMVLAHRWIYEQTHGSIPAGLVMDHFKCDNKRCVNPDHVRPVSNRENLLRGDTPASRLLARPVCPKCGGEWSPRPVSSGGGRICMTCHKDYLARRRGTGER